MSKHKAGNEVRIIALDPCLKPLHPELARSFDAVLISLDGTPTEQGVVGVTLLSGESRVDLETLCAPLSFADADAGIRPLSGSEAYAAACLAFDDEDPNTAGLGFALALADSAYQVAAIYGVACALAMRGAHRACLTLTRFLVASGGDHPVFSALAGNAAAALNDATQTRRHLARAARLSRNDASFRDILRFSQRTLLIQQFGS